MLSCVLCLLFLINLGLSATITGPTGGVQASGQRPFRTNINDFVKSGPAFDLYIQSLQKFQNQNQTNQLSYFLVSGIRSMPGNGARANDIRRNTRTAIYVMG